MRLISNTDRLIHVTLPAGTPRGTVVYDQIITPSIAARLRTQASLFQKVTYARLRFEVQTQTPTTNGGGYVVSFLHDPQMDIGTGEAALRALTAVQGTQTSKFWQSVDMSIQTTSQQYFTLNGNDVRLFSPGRFVVLSDGAPTEPVAITILMHWTVGFTRPALQRLVNTLPQAVVTSSVLYSGTQNLRYANWNSQTNVYTPAIGAEGSDHLQDAVIGLPAIATIGTNVLWYQIPYPVALEQDVTPTVATSSAFFVSFRVVDGNLIGRLHTLPNDANVIWANANATAPRLIANTRLTPVLQDEFHGNTDGPFLVSASQSVSVNRQPMISKEYQELQRTVSLSPPQSREALIDKLSRMQLTE